MIETIEEFNKFESDNNEGDWIFFILPENNEYLNIFPISIVFIKNLKTSKIYYCCINHPDSIVSNEVKILFLNYIKNDTRIKWCIDKKFIIQCIDLKNLKDINLLTFIDKNETLDPEIFHTLSHNLMSHRCPSITKNEVNKYVPLMKHLECFQSICSYVEDVLINKSVECSAFDNINDKIIPTLASLEKPGMFVDVDKFKDRFGNKKIYNSIVYNKYNLYTSTGRPSNHYDGINFAALSSKDGSKKCFTSRFGDKDGRIVVIDYVTFHPRIICKLLNYKIPSDINIYEYLAKLYFNKTVVDEYDISESKKLTFKQLYGGVEKKYQHIKYLNRLRLFINRHWKKFEEDGYALTPIFQRKITQNHIKDPTPEKLFNYILQAAEGEIAIPLIGKVIKYLEKGKRSIPVLYVYDSLVLDFHKNDGKETLNDIIKILSNNNQFPLKCYIGKTYQDLSLI